MIKSLENRELKAFASHSDFSLGRFYNDIPLQFNRTEFQRDRDRIIYSDAFRRLKQKTQVFVGNYSDHFRTRLTHTLEVAQLSRSISRYLYLNDDLSESIALAHDLGHPPYGHAGEDVLSNLMKDHGGFNHNEQSLRIVTFLEKNYPNFTGLNLTFETLEGIIKHNGPFKRNQNIPETVLKLQEINDFNLYKFPSAEAQVANICDDIAYVSHDLNDGLKSKLLSLEEIETIPLIKKIMKLNQNIFNKDNKKIYIDLIARNLINYFVYDLVSKSSDVLIKNKFSKANDIRNYNELVIKMNNDTYKSLLNIKSFLLQKMYKNNVILQELSHCSEKISKMFYFLVENPLKLPKRWHCEGDIFILDFDIGTRSRIVCDYIAGMTENFFHKNYNDFKLN